jgi:serine/threonine-protein kinase
VRCSICHAENPEGAATCSGCGASLQRTSDVVVTAVNFSPGTLFHGRYVIEGPLGHGGMGMVYKARDRTLDEPVALKVLRPDFALDPKMAERFRGEIKLARRVRHKNVCAIHDYGEDSGLLYISMEFIDGTDLKHVLRDRGALPAEQALDVAIQVAEGLQAVHDEGIIHRDLKSTNIMLDERGLARLMDFGIAKRQGEVTLTSAGQVVGTPEYMSPEQARGAKVDFRSDVYSLAIVTYEIFTGRVPFKGDTPISTILKQINDPPPLDEAPRLPREVKHVLRQALAKEPDDRYATAAQLAEALRRSRSPSLRQEPVPTAVLVAPTVKGVLASRRGAVPSAVGAFAVALTVVGLVTYVGWFRGGEGRGAAIPSPGPVTSPLIAVPAPSPTGATASPATLRPSPHAPVMPAATPSVQAERVALEQPSVAPPKSTPAPTPTPVQQRGTGLLQVGVKPWAEVTVDGIVMGTTPLDRLSLPAGVHTVQFRHPRYGVVERKVTIRPGETEHLVVDLAEGAPQQP